MNKKQIIDKIVNDLPTSDMRGEMTKEEWYGWFEECWDKAIDYTTCCTDEAEQLKCEHKGRRKATELVEYCEDCKKILFHP